MMCRTGLVASWPQIDPHWIMPAQAGLSWPQVGPSWLKVAQVGTKCIPSWLHVGPMLPHVGPSWTQVGSKLAPSWPMLAEVGLSGSTLAPSWPQDGKIRPFPKRPRRLCLAGLGFPRCPRRLYLKGSDGCLFVLTVPSSCFRSQRLFLFGASVSLPRHGSSFNTMYSKVPLK